MPILVDGNNLLHRLPSGRRARADLRTLCLDLVRRSKTRITVVFDGAPDPGAPAREHLGQLTILYAAPKSADDAIIAALRGCRESASWVVVTDDRQLRERARRAGARLRSLAEWLPKLGDGEQTPPREQPLSLGELAEWEELFSRGQRRDD